MVVIALLTVLLVFLWLIANFIHGGTMGLVFLVSGIAAGTFVTWLVTYICVCEAIGSGKDLAPPTELIILLLTGTVCGFAGAKLIRLSARHYKRLNATA
jgi:uncharacterized membrane protein